jgi:SpoVK/Ycf46/Vps4 family AAA+-type ATPase
MGDTRDLGLLLDAGVPLIAVESPDERRVLGLLLQFAMKRGLGYFEWSSTRGLRRGGIGGIAASNGGAQPKPRHAEPDALLEHIAATSGPNLYALCDFHPFLDARHDQQALLVRHLKDIALEHGQLGNTIVFVSHKLTVPPELGRLTATFRLRLPSDEELMAMIRAQAQQWSRRNKGARVRTDQRALSALVANLRGVSHTDAEMLIRHAIFSDGMIADSDIPEVNRLKFELLSSEGILHLEQDTESFAHIAGLDNMKAWLRVRREALLASDRDRPRGILLLGVQGSGKSLAAKAVAGQFSLPLLRLDFGSLYNKYFGETERNLRDALKQAETMAPCVLWMDEIEKGISTGGGDNATSRRVLGTLLTWMAENGKPVFLVATSNDISQLPPELMRKGRIDEVFFVDLPDDETRRAILRIHLAKRDLEPDDFDLDRLTDVSQGFTGAEIEQAIVSARHLAASNGQSVTSDDVVDAIQRTYPLSVLRADDIEQLRAWARDRTVPA